MSEKSPITEYKTRLYEHYLSQHVRPKAGEMQSILASRGPYLKRMIARWMPSGRDARVLDLGCGYGAIMYFLRAAGYIHVTGIDTSPEQVSAAHELGLADVHCGNVYPFLQQTQDQSFEVVIAFDIFEHLAKMELLELGDELHRILSPGGRIIMHAPNGEGVFSGTIRHGDLTHEMAFTRANIAQFAGACSFSVVAVQEDTPVIHGIKSLIRSVLWHLISFPLRLLAAADTGAGVFSKPLSQNLLAVLERRQHAS
jgi:2-polyprenyl-3-methyl-5-hydroxy-6-metoxy-1,4-benzoquinol methylase